MEIPMYPAEDGFDSDVECLKDDVKRLQMENEILINDLGHVAHEIGAEEFSTKGVLDRVKELLEVEAMYKGLQK